MDNPETTKRQPEWLAGYILATETACIALVPDGMDPCQRMDFIDGAMRGFRDARNADLEDMEARS